MIFPAKPQPRAVPSILPRINWSHPLAMGLCGAFLPGVAYTANLVDAIIPELASQVNASLTQTPEGPALSGSSSNAGMFAVAPAEITSFTNLSMYYRGRCVANSTNAAMWLGVGYNTTPTTPFNVAQIGAGSSGSTTSCRTTWNQGGTRVTKDIGNPFTVNAMESYAASFVVGGNVLSYRNGALVDTTAFGASPPNFQSTAQFAINTAASGNNVTAGTHATVALIWNRVLSTEEMAWLDADPYALFVFPTIWPGASIGGTVYNDSASESVSATDVVSAGAVAAVSASDALSALDAQTAVGIFAAAVSEAASAADSVSAQLSLYSNVVEILSAVDVSDIVNAVWSAVVAEVANASDATNSANPFVDAVVESALAQELITVTQFALTWYLSFAHVVPPPNLAGPGDPGVLGAGFRLKQVYPEE